MQHNHQLSKPTLSDESARQHDSLPTKLDRLSDNISHKKSPTLSGEFKTSGKKIISSLSFSHIVELLTVEDPLVRYFYEQECIKCTWSVRELRRQITTNLYFRTGFSSNPEKMLSLPALQGHDSAALQFRQPLKGKKMVEYALANTKGKHGR